MSEQPADQRPSRSTAEPSDEVRPTGRPNARLGQTIADMARSMVIVLVVVGAILLVTWRPQPEAVRAVDPTSALTSARATAGYPIVYPDDLGPGWVPTSARWSLPAESAPDPAWHVGFVTPDERYVQIGQSKTTNPDYIPAQTMGGLARGEEPDGWQGLEGWQAYETTGVEPTRSLVTVVDGVTLVVSGTASWETLVDVAAKLSPTAVAD